LVLFLPPKDSHTIKANCANLFSDDGGNGLDARNKSLPEVLVALACANAGELNTGVGQKLQ
jgi:hypothetical protein